ncbi:ribose-5-phosphate isomerase RpiA [Fructobacillus sp. W13]|uniref:Ribose-5-phosphate isomerase A n=1 Tax=Fructobacillus apis TaxID=2935017 RepID=A0ABT0ZQX9_9LACO|nr:ribose-5-phosphate isomerase RpiA [Fructobacillus apis]MCO0832393.1 ribose-5-phosphate isomerase RpiA [Fructobacillus apis]
MDDHKVKAAQMAVDLIPNQAIVGLGSGSTASIFIDLLAKKAHEESMDITCVATSGQTQQLALGFGLKVVDIDAVDHIDITVDGADEVDPDLNGIKGGGAALLFEKIVAMNSHKNIWVVDSSKRHPRLGSYKLPVEVVKFGVHHVYNYLKTQDLKPVYRQQEDGNYLTTDSGNYIIDIDISRVDDLSALADDLKSLTGVVEHGLFIEVCDVLLVGNTGEAIYRTKE